MSASPGASVLIAEGTPASFRAEVIEACRDLALEWHPLRSRSAPDGSARIIVGALRAGARKVPDGLLEAAARGGDDTTLVLVAAEPLVRPAVTLEGGRVIVLGGGTARARVKGVLRMLTGRAPAPSAVADGQPRAWTTSLTADTWLAHAPPCRCRRTADGLAAVVPFDAEAWGDGDGADSLLDAVAAANDVEALARVGEGFGADAGAVRLALDARAWLVYWPRADRPAWLHSLVRLPHAADLAAGAAMAEGRVLRFSAHSGDVAFLLGVPLDDAASFTDTAEHGAAAILERAETVGNLNGLVAEVR